jgi:RimJ/RimL family protein N-acetyltransferase
MEIQLQTERLILRKLSLHDTRFIFDLVNTPQWVKFIGNRNVNTLEDSRNYIIRTLKTPNVDYWIVTLKDQSTPIGIVTLIKRTYLEHHDIGFAFLPEYQKNGYAFEASGVVLDATLKNTRHSTVLATTLRDNVNSIQLLLKLGFSFLKEIEVEGEPLLIYTISPKPGIA